MRAAYVIALLAAGAALLAGDVTAAPAPAVKHPGKRCKVVVKRVHGHRKRIRVCRPKRKPKPRPKPKPEPAADLVLTVKASSARITAGNQASYTIKVENRGPEVAEGASLSVTFPAGTEPPDVFPSYTSEGLECEARQDAEDGPVAITCKLGDLLPTSATNVGSDEKPLPPIFVFTAEPEHAGTFVLDAQAESDTRDPSPANARVRTTTAVSAGPASADLAVAVHGAPDPAAVTKDFKETITITNHGPTEATAVQVPVLLPQGTQIVGYENVFDARTGTATPASSAPPP